MSWLKSWTVNEVLGASDLNSNFDKLQTTYNALPLHADGRLTLTSGTPITTADVTAAGTLYYTPNDKGSLISIYDGSMWVPYTLTEKSISISGKVKGILYDVFITATAGVLSLSVLAWKNVRATNSPTAGASKVINLSDTGDLAVGREVTVFDGTNSEIATISAVVNNTSITVENLVNGYTLPYIYGYAQRATALTNVNGVPVKSGSTSERYLGTIRIAETDGQTEDSYSKRYVWNYYNRVPRPMKAVDTTDGWTYTTAAWRAANANTSYGVGRFGFVTGYAGEFLDAIHTAAAHNGTLGDVFFAGGIGLNSTTVNSAQVFGGNCGRAQGTVASNASAFYRGYPGIGIVYVQRLEISTASNTTNWVGDNASTMFQTGMVGTIMG